MIRRVPIITFVVVALSVLVHLVPGAALLAYDRNAILGGEWWRMVTGHWVHFSTQHFVYDTAAFGIAGWMIEDRGCKNFGWLCVLAILVISTSMMIFEPRLQMCGGLSGLATAAVVFLALEGSEDEGGWQWMCRAALLLCAAKLLFELIAGRFLLLQAPDSLAPVPSNHIAGALTALGVSAWPKITHRLRLQTVFTG
jgi:rhomboid family GlyGly-CTERM serine protease